MLRVCYVERRFVIYLEMIRQWETNLQANHPEFGFEAGQPLEGTWHRLDKDTLSPDFFQYSQKSDR